ncbi:lytic transglycosylase domain-containing protein [Methylocaldum marinum]|nr:lytic transglycosylase domain-containing protein [Methylocaldum marinum]
MTYRLICGLLVAVSVLLTAGCYKPATTRTSYPVYHGSLHRNTAPPGAAKYASVIPVTRFSDSAPGYAGTSSISASSDLFPKPGPMETQVAFWRNVYGVWSRSQVILHDDRFMDVIYQVIQLPGNIMESYTPIQKELIQERKAYWQYRLRDLEQKVAAGANLAPDDRRLLSKFGRNGSFRSALQGASGRLRAQRGLRERFKRGLEISGRYDRHFRAIFREAGLPEDLAYLPHVESSFQTQARSSAGAVGVWQFTRAAAERFMTVNSVIDERLDPVASARGAARYLSHAYGKLGSWPLAITSYNHGISGMMRAKQAFGYDFMRIVSDYDHPLFGFASRNFYAEFLAAREIARQPSRFFHEGIRYEKSLDWDRVVLAENAFVSSLARQYDTDKSRLISLNAAWTGPAQSDKAALPAGTEVWLPSGTLRQIASRAPQNRLAAQKSESKMASPNVKVIYPGNTAPGGPGKRPKPF